jgi:hypothetical protein
MAAWAVTNYQVLKDFAGPTVALSALVVTVCLGIAGLKTFGRWKREKLEEKRIEVAIDTLAIGYEARLVFERIRLPVVGKHEYEEMGPGKVDVSAMARRMKGMAYAVLKRVETNKDFFEKVYTSEAKAVAIFGTRAERVFNFVHQARWEVELSATSLMQYYERNDDGEPEPLSKEHAERWFVNIFCSRDVAGNDSVSLHLADFRNGIQELCGPVMAHEFASEKVLERMAGSG